MALQSLTLNEAQQIIGRVAENPASAGEISTRKIVEALCRLIVSNGLLAVAPSED